MRFGALVTLDRAHRALVSDLPRAGLRRIKYCISAGLP